MTQIADYLASVKTFEGRKGEAEAVATMIGDLSSALKTKLPEFLHFNCNIPMRVTSERYVDKIRFDFTKWPTADDIKTRMVTLAQSHQAMVSAWNRIPETDRAGLKSPPQGYSLR